MLNLGRFVREHATYRPNSIAMRMGEHSFSYAQLETISNKIAHYLAEMGIGKNDKVALTCPNLPYFPMVYYGILKAGAVVVPLNVLFKQREIAYHLTDSDAKAYFVFEGTAELPMAQAGKAAFDEVRACEHFVVITADPKAAGPIENAMTLGKILATQETTFELAATEAADTAVILYTSGTTGQPKGAELSHLNMVMNAMASTSLFEAPNVHPTERVFLMVLPLFHSFGQTCGMNSMFHCGGQITMLPRFDAAQALATIKNHKVNVFAGVPTMYWAMLNEASKLSKTDLETISTTLKICASGGSAMPVELLKNFEKTFKVPIMEGYGLSETSPIASFNHLTRERKPGSVGQPIFGVEMNIVDSNDQPLPNGELGEIVIRGHNIMKSYYKRPEASQEALRGGWFHSGDLGKRDDEGYYFILDRVKDMIIRSGFNVYPREIEEVLMTHPAVSLAAVIGIPDDEHGEEIHAYIVPKAGASVTAQELIGWSKEMMAAYKYPRQIILRESLPMTATGKILKRELRSEASKT